MEYVAGIPAQQEKPTFVNNTLHSLFSDCNITAHGIKISSANGNYAHKAFIETEFSHNKEAKDTWLKYQGYTYEPDPAALASTVLLTGNKKLDLQPQCHILVKLPPMFILVTNTLLVE